MDTKDLTVKKDRLSVAASSGQLGNIIKPLSRQIHLFDTFVAGTSHLRDKSVLEKISVGDSLNLQRENNKFDQKAILVLNSRGEKLGYLPEKDNLIFSRLMDAGKLLQGKITQIEQLNSFTKISIGIYLVDF